MSMRTFFALSLLAIANVALAACWTSLRTRQDANDVERAEARADSIASVES